MTTAPAPSEQRDRLLRVDQVCRELNCCKSTVYFLAHAGELRLVRIGKVRGYRILESSLTNYVRRQIERFED